MASVDAFGYAYSLTIGIPEKLIKIAVPENNIADTQIVAPKPEGGAETDYRTEPSRSFEVIDKQLVAEIDNSKDTDSPAVISVYNLNSDQLALIKENSSVILRAGYKTELDVRNPDRKKLPLVYVGQVVAVKTNDNGVDKVTEIICSEGRTPLRNIKISLSWPPGTKYQDMLLAMAEIASGVGIPLGKYTGDERVGTSIFRETTLALESAPNGYQVAGIFEEELKRLADNAGFRAYMSLGKLYIEPKYLERSVEYVRVSSNNIKGTIEIEEDGSVGLSGDLAEKNGITFKTFLNGNISTNKFLRLEKLLNSQFEGDFKIESTKHSLNFEGGVWETEISATRIK